MGDRPVVLVGYAAALLTALAPLLPERSVIFVEEPDVIRKRGVGGGAAHPTLRELIGWEYQRDAAADRFFHAHRGLDPAAVVPVSDYAVPFAARLAERFGVPGAGYGAALLLRDKHLLRTVTAAAGIANPASVVVRGPGEVKAFMAEQGGPIVLKPANRRASVGTRIIHDPGEVEAAWVECADQDEGIYTPDRPMTVTMLAERYVAGDEYSVEMTIHSGRPVFGGVTRKFLFAGARPVEQGHLHPADIPPELTARLLADTAGVLGAVGMDTGIVHCEWMVDAGTPYLIECGGRMAGDGIIELVRLAWRYDLVAEFYRMMMGQPAAVPVPEMAVRGAAVWYGRAAPGRVTGVDGVERARAVPGVHICSVGVAVGDEIRELRSSWDRTAMVITEAATADQALAAARQAVEQITVRTGD